MDVAVDKAGQDRRAGQVMYLGAVRNGQIAAGGDHGRAVDDDSRVPDDAGAVE
jgi:hypothetical protein